MRALRLCLKVSENWRILNCIRKEFQRRREAHKYRIIYFFYHRLSCACLHSQLPLLVLAWDVLVNRSKNESQSVANALPFSLMTDEIYPFFSFSEFLYIWIL